MMRILGVVAVLGFMLAMGFMALAFWMGGGRIGLASHFKGIAPLTQSAGMKEWAWGDGDRIELDIPAVLHYAAGGPARITVRGDADTVNHVQFAHGKLGADSTSLGDDDTVDVTLHGATVRDFSINGTGKLELGHIDQDALRIHISGEGSAEAEGRADAVDLHISGEGTAHLGKLAAKVVKIHISGQGEAEVAPSEAVEVHISGAGTVKLLTKPKSIASHISGAGRIVEAP